MSRTFGVLVAVVIVGFAAFGYSALNKSSGESPSDVVQSAATAYVDGYNNRDLTQFHSYFATVKQGADSAGLALTLGAADTEMNKAQVNDMFQLQDFKIVSEQVDNKNHEATVHYQATVAVVQDQTNATFAGIIEQDVALVRVGNKWLISGGDDPQITPNVPAPISSELG